MPTGVMTHHRRTVAQMSKPLLPTFCWTLTESVSELVSCKFHDLARSNKETAPRCHRLTRRAGCQKATTEPSQQGLQSLFNLCHPMDTRQLNELVVSPVMVASLVLTTGRLKTAMSWSTMHPLMGLCLCLPVRHLQ